MAHQPSALARSAARFLRDESGAVTVDFVVLAGGIVGLVMALMSTLNESLYQNAGLRIAADITEAAQR